MSEEALLTVDNVTLFFGKSVAALDKVSMVVHKGEIHGLIGPNGAGKTSLLNCISGIYKPRTGNIIFKEKDITQCKGYEIPKLGVARTFQNVELFGGMTVLECLMFGRHLYTKYNIFLAGLYKIWAEKEEIYHRRVVEEVIDFLEMEKIRDVSAHSLPYGLQKRVGLGIAQAMEPEFILLDEPMAGLNLEEREDMVRFIVDLNEEKGMTVLLVEHDMGVVMDISDKITVLNFGHKICDGTPSEIQESQEVIKAYLGGH
jgi:branched-chain amino acid transport system ATP-binding protein